MAASGQRTGEVRTAPAGRTAARVAVVCAAFAAVAAYMVYLSPLNPWHGEFDLKVYRGAVVWWLNHRPLYSFHRNKTPYGFTYPPFAAVAMLPMAWFTEVQAEVVQMVANALTVIGTTWWLVSPVAARHGWSRWFAVALAVPVVYVLEPVRETLAYGQVNLYLVALVMLDVVWLARGSRFAGIGIGLATAIKLTPGLFILYLILTGRWRQAGMALGTFLAVTLGTFVIAPGTSTQFWTSILFETKRVGRVGSADNQSLLGLMTRLAGTGAWVDRLWLPAAAAVLAVGMVRARRAWLRGDELVGITLTGLTSCLVSPISWTHHLYWIVPAALVLIDVAAGTRLDDASWHLLRGRPRATKVLAGGAAAVVMGVFGLSLVWLMADFDGTLHGTGLVVALVTSIYALVMLALLVVLPARDLAGDTLSSPRRGAGNGPLQFRPIRADKRNGQ